MPNAAGIELRNATGNSALCCLKMVSGARMLGKLTLIRDGLKADGMARHGSMMAIFGLLGGFFAYLYQLSMGIMLTPVQYGMLLSLTSLFAIIMIASQAIQTTLAKFTSKFRAENSLGKINYLWRFSLKRTLVFGAALFLALALLTPLFSRFLHIDNQLYPIVLFSSLILAFAVPANLGVLQGLQRFFPLGFSTSFSAFLRFAIGASLVYLGFKLYGGLIPFLIANIIVFLITLSFLKDLDRAGNEKCEVSGLSSYTGLAFLAIFAFAVLTNIDVVLAKHYLSPENAGNYSAISVLGRIALYAPMGVAVAMFPKTSELFEMGRGHRSILRKAMLLTLLLAGGVVIIYWLFPDFIVNLLFGGEYPLAIPYLFKYGLAMSFFAISFLFLSLFLSRNQTKVAYAFLSAMLIEIGLIIFFHASIAQIVDIMLISGTLCLVFILPFYLRERRREAGGGIYNR